MAKNIYLASRGVLNLPLFGHLFFILWDDELETGRTTEGQGLSILHGEVDLSNTDEDSEAEFDSDFFDEILKDNITSASVGWASAHVL